MKNITRKNSLLLLIAFIIAGLVAMCFMDASALQIDGEPIGGVLAFGIGTIGLMIGVIGLFFALSVTGLLLAGVAIFLALLVVFILGALALALTPLLLPFLLLAGLLMLISRRKTV
ncbi:hypothetical protein [Undibacterium sp. Ren11W]|uniref:hypothetical protein n=1 Tax=Undibacterium sp. Ren11W TaxID=3413045 RepID=UPI003BF18DB5